MSGNKKVERPKTNEEANDRVDKWHNDRSETPLHTALGWTSEEYHKWVETNKLPDPAVGQMNG